MVLFLKKITPVWLWNLLRAIFHAILCQLQNLKMWRFRVFGRPYRWLESSKARPRREREGFFEKYCQGKGLDIGYGGDPIVKGARGWDMEHGDAQHLAGLDETQFDFVYSSHTIEDMPDCELALRNWWAPLKPGGFLILYLPHRDLYEKSTRLPSKWNRAHQHFFLIDADEEPDTLGLLPLLQRAVPDGEIIYARICDEGHTITDPTIHSDGEYSIEAVIRKAS